MNYLLRQEYNNWFDYLGKVVIELYNQDKTNVNGKNLMKAASKVGTYVNSLHLEYDMTKTRLEAYKKENRKLKQEIEELKNKLKNHY